MTHNSHTTLIVIVLSILTILVLSTTLVDAETPINDRASPRRPKSTPTPPTELSEAQRELMKQMQENLQETLADLAKKEGLDAKDVKDAIKEGVDQVLDGNTVDGDGEATGIANAQTAPTVIHVTADMVPEEVKKALAKELNLNLDDLTDSRTDAAATPEPTPEGPIPGEDKYDEAVLLRQDLIDSCTKDDHEHPDVFEIQEYFSLLEKSAQLGFGDAGSLLGHEYMNGCLLGGKSNLSRSAEEWEWAAKGGCTSSHAGLGFLYAAGVESIGYEADTPMSLLHYAFAARGNDPDGRLAMGYRCLHGIGVSHSCTRATKYYKAAAEAVVDQYQQDTGAARLDLKRKRLAVEEVHGPEDEEREDRIVEYVGQAAQGGDASAMAAMGQLHFNGQYGVPQDRQIARQWFERAANEDNPVAQANLGHIYANGYGVDVNYALAKQLYEEALKRNESSAHVGLGIMYLEGQGVAKNYELAMKHFTLAAAANNPDGMVNLGMMHLSGMGTPISYKLAFECFMNGARHDNLIAKFYLAQLHENGLGVAQNCEAAVRLYKSVAERGLQSRLLDQAHSLFRKGQESRALMLYEYLAHLGFELAQHNAAWMYDRGKGMEWVRMKMRNGNEEDEQEDVDGDVEEEKEKKELLRFRYQNALLFYRKAAAQHNIAATLRLGDIFYYGLGTNPSAKQAAIYYADAARHNEPQALYNMGVMHQFGDGLPQDFFLAKRFYDNSISKHKGITAFPVYLALGSLAVHFVLSRPEDVLPVLLSCEFPAPIQWVLSISEICLKNWELVLLFNLIAALATVSWMRWRHIRVRWGGMGEEI